MPDPLFAGLPGADALERDTASLVPYAQLLRDLVYRRLYPTGAADLDAPSSDAMFDAALRAVLERMLADRLQELTPEQFVAAYRSVHGDAALAEALERLAEEHRRTVARDLRLARMARQWRVSGRLLLGELDAGEVLTVALFDPAQPQLAAYRFRENTEVRPLHRLLQVRLTVPAEGGAEIVSDTWTGAVWSERLRTPLGAALTPGVLGSRPADAPDAAPRPELTLHAPVVFRPDDGGAELAPPQVVGYVQALDGRLLLDEVSPAGR